MGGAIHLRCLQGKAKEMGAQEMKSSETMTNIAHMSPVLSGRLLCLGGTCLLGNEERIGGEIMESSETMMILYNVISTLVGCSVRGALACWGMGKEQRGQRVGAPEEGPPREGGR